MIFPILKNYDNNRMQMHYHIVCRQTLNYLYKQAKTILMFYFVVLFCEFHFCGNRKNEKNILDCT